MSRLFINASTAIDVIFTRPPLLMTPRKYGVGVYHKIAGIFPGETGPKEKGFPPGISEIRPSRGVIVSSGVRSLGVSGGLRVYTLAPLKPPGYLDEPNGQPC